jgi:hypothetical protein
MVRLARPLFAALGSVLLCASAAAALEGYRILDRAKVYHGFADAFTTPAVVDSTKVKDSLPAMKKIREEKIVKESARWYVLINEANQHFQKVLRVVAKEGSYDLIAEVGSISGPKSIPNVTDSAISAIGRE